MTIQGRPSLASSLDLLADKRLAPDYVPPPSAPVSWEQFLAWLDEDTFAEWVDGEIIETPPVRDEHQFILGFLSPLLMAVVEEPELGLVYLAPFKLHLPVAPERSRTGHVFSALGTCRSCPRRPTSRGRPISWSRSFRARASSETIRSSALSTRRPAFWNTGSSIRSGRRRPSTILAKTVDIEPGVSTPMGSIRHESSQVCVCASPGSGNGRCRSSTPRWRISRRSGTDYPVGAAGWRRTRQPQAMVSASAVPRATSP